MRLLCFSLSLLFLLVLSSVSLAIPGTATSVYSAKTTQYYLSTTGVSVLYPSIPAACVAGPASTGTAFGWPSGSYKPQYISGQGCKYVRNSDYRNVSFSITSYVACPAGYATTGQAGASACAMTTYTCPSGYLVNDLVAPTHDDYCLTEPVSPCAENAGVVTSGTVFYGNTATAGSASTPYSPPTVICLGTCRSAYMGSEDCYTQAYLPSDPSFGLHAIMCKAKYIGMDQACEAGDATSPNASAPASAPVPEPPSDQAPECPQNTYAIKSGTQWICNPVTTPVPPPDSEGCPPGTTPGTVNGVLVCAPSANTPPPPGVPGTGTPGTGGAVGGSGSGGSAGGAAGGSGAGGDGATSDTGGAVGGAVGGDGDPEGVGKTSLGVDCGVPPVCSGDPLLCGIQLQEWQSSCDIQKAVASPLPDAELAKWKAVGSQVEASPQAAAGVARVQSTLASFSSRLSFSIDGCPPDFSISVMGASIPIAISKACSLLQVLKMLLFMGAYLFSLRVLWSAVSN